MALTVKKDNTEKFLKSIQALVKNEVLVGIPDTNATRQPEPGGSDPASNAVIGYIMETGSPAKNIPARPFLVPGVQDAVPQIVAQMKKGGEAALSGDLSKIEQAQIATGLIAQSSVKAKITAGAFQPLSEKTLKARKRRGRTGEKPLIDSAQLLNAVTYVVRPKGG